MSNGKLPVGANPKHIGRVVTIQVFRRVAGDPDALHPESLEKHVGTLESYYHDKRSFMFRLVGGERTYVTYSKQHVEIILPDPIEV